MPSLRQREIDDRGGAYDLERSGKKLAEGDAGLGIGDVEAADRQRPEMDDRAELVERDARQHQEADDERQTLRKIEEAGDEARLEGQHDAAEKDRAIGEGEGAKAGDDGDLANRKPIRL